MCFAFVSPLFFHRIYTHTEGERKAAILTLQGFAGGSELHASLRLWLCVCSLIKIEKVALAAAAYAASLRRSRRHTREAYRGLKSEIDRDRKREGGSALAYQHRVLRVSVMTLISNGLSCLCCGIAATN